MGSDEAKPRRTFRGVFWRVVACLILIPVILAMAASIPEFLKDEIRPTYFRGLKTTAIFFFSGAGIYLLLHIFLHRPITTYVFAHELTHSLWARLTGQKVKRVTIDKKSGQTITVGSNFLVRLAPYCIPFYTLALIVIWVVLQFIFPRMGRFVDLLYGGIGFTYAFHVLMTLHFLKVGQSDLHAEGYCFAVAVILAANIEIAIALASTMAYRKAAWLNYQVMVWKCLVRWGGDLLEMLR